MGVSGEQEIATWSGVSTLPQSRDASRETRVGLFRGVVGFSSGASRVWNASNTSTGSIRRGHLLLYQKTPLMLIAKIIENGLGVQPTALDGLNGGHP